MHTYRGNTLDSHRLIYFAGQQGLDKQHNLVEEFFQGYMTQGKYIGDRYVFISSGYSTFLFDSFLAKFI